MVKLIWCEDKKHGIAKNNKLPWNIPEELKHFKKITSKHVVLMGYNTFESIGKPLSNRTNVVLTRKHKENLPNEIITYQSIKNFFEDFKNTDIFIIGGKSIYELTLPYADELIVSTISRDYKCDLFFEPNLAEFECYKKDNFDKFKVHYYKKIKNKDIKLIDSNNDEYLKNIVFNLNFENFNGPFDLLLTLIHDKKMDIMNLDLAELTTQYLNYIKKYIKNVELELITDYLIMASYLIELKSKKIVLLTYSDDDEQNTDLTNNKERDRLVRSLIEYKHYRDVLPKLEQLQMERNQMLAKDPDDWKMFEPPKENDDPLEAPLPEYINPIRLYDAMQRVISRFKNRMIADQKIVVQELSIEDVQNEVFEIIVNSKAKRISLTRILNHVDRLRVSDMYFVTCFVALLVLTRYQKINMFQHEMHGEIYVELNKKNSTEEFEESIEDMIKRQEEYKRETEEYKKQIMKQRAEEYRKKREEYLKQKYGDAYVSREKYLKMTEKEREELKIKQQKIISKNKKLKSNPNENE